METLLQVKLLGGFDILIDGIPSNELNTNRLQSLFAYLVLNCKSPISRQQLAFHFWPDTTDAQARTNLRHLLHSLRIALPVSDQFLIFDRHVLRWTEMDRIKVDVYDFEDLAERVNSTQALREAVDLYSGDLLPEIYDEWILVERERLRQVYLSTLERLMMLLENERDYQTAIHYGRLLLEQDPLREEHYRLLIRLYVLSDDRAGALRIYHACVAALQRELNVEPSQATYRAYRSLLDLDEQAVVEKASTDRVAPMVGRREEWGLIQSVWRQTSRGQPHLVVISGEAGVGKTRLAEEMVRWTSRQGLFTKEAHCFALHGELPFTPLVAWLRQHPLPDLDSVWLVELCRLLPEVKRNYPSLSEPSLIQEDWQRLRLFEAITHAILNGQHTVLLYLDDVQWCDQQSLDWLRFLLNLSNNLPTLVKNRKIMVLSTLRSEEQDANKALPVWLSSLREKDQLTEINLCPLDENSTALLASHVSGRVLTTEEATWLYRETEGNPLYVVETMRSGLSEQLPTKVHAVIASRLVQLSSTARKVGNLAAVIGRQFAYPVLMNASDLDEKDLVVGLDELWQRRIIREFGSEAYDFSHEKIREVIYAGLSAVQRRQLHRRVARSLERVFHRRLDEFCGQIAVHFETAGNLTEALSYYLLAAEAARKVFSNQDIIN